MGKVEREPASRGGPLAAPKGTPVKQGGEKQDWWGGSTHKGVSSGNGQVGKTGRADHSGSHPLRFCGAWAVVACTGAVLCRPGERRGCG